MKTASEKDIDNMDVNRYQGDQPMLSDFRALNLLIIVWKANQNKAKLLEAWGFGIFFE